MKAPTPLKDIIGKCLHAAQHEMSITLPDRLLLAFTTKAHCEDLDPATGKPFASLYAWLWAMPPAGCGLCASRYLDAEDIISQLKKSRTRTPEAMCGPIDALITDLVTGHGASKGKGGRPKKGHGKNLISTNQVLNGSGRGSGRTRHASTLAARLAESTEPAFQHAWQDYLVGKHRSVTAAAIACGLIKDSNRTLSRLKHFWSKATDADRHAFLAWLRDTQPTPESFWQEIISEEILYDEP